MSPKAPTAYPLDWSEKYTSRNGSPESASIPAACLLHVAPPSLVASITPLCPTAHPLCAVGNVTAVKVTLTGTFACTQLLPLSDERTMMPPSPTATIPRPARATASNTDDAGLRLIVAEVISGSKGSNVGGCPAQKPSTTPPPPNPNPPSTPTFPPSLIQ